MSIWYNIVTVINVYMAKNPGLTCYHYAWVLVCTCIIFVWRNHNPVRNAVTQKFAAFNLKDPDYRSKTLSQKVFSIRLYIVSIQKIQCACIHTLALYTTIHTTCQRRQVDQTYHHKQSASLGNNTIQYLRLKNSLMNWCWSQRCRELFFCEPCDGAQRERAKQWPLAGEQNRSLFRTCSMFVLDVLAFLLGFHCPFLSNQSLMPSMPSIRMHDGNKTCRAGSKNQRRDYQSKTGCPILVRSRRALIGLDHDSTGNTWLHSYMAYYKSDTLWYTMY